MFQAVVKYLLDEGADADLAMANGDTALITAASLGLYGMVRLLLQRAPDITARASAAGALGRTALHVSSIAARGDIARLLIACGADIHARDAENTSPYDKAGMMLRSAMPFLHACAVVVSYLDDAQLAPIETDSSLSSPSMEPVPAPSHGAQQSLETASVSLAAANSFSSPSWGQGAHGEEA